MIGPIYKKPSFWIGFSIPIVTAIVIRIVIFLK